MINKSSVLAKTQVDLTETLRLDSENLLKISRETLQQCKILMNGCAETLQQNKILRMVQDLMSSWAERMMSPGDEPWSSPRGSCAGTVSPCSRPSIQMSGCASRVMRDRL